MPAFFLPMKMIEFGYCERPHGVKGGLSLILHNGEESYLESKPSVLLIPREHRHKKSKLPAKGQKFNVKSITLGHKVILYLEGIESMNAAEEIIPFTLMVNEEELPEPDADELYIKDLFGLIVFDDDSLEQIGEVIEVYDNGVQLILSIKMTNNEIMDVPYIDHFVKGMNLEEKKIFIKKPEWID